MDPARLFRKIGKHGDSLWAGKLPEKYGGLEIPLDSSAPFHWSFLYHLFGKLEDAGEPWSLWVVVWLSLFPLAILDSAQLLIRGLLYPLVLLIWWCEKRLALFQGRRYFCAVCHKLMDDPWVYCLNPRCPRRVQTRLRPTFNSLFIRRCLVCDHSRWLLLGQRHRFPPQPLVCRHTYKLSGCYHPLRIPALQGQATLHFAIVGTTVAAKHTVMSHMFHQLTGSSSDESYRTAWDVSQMELELSRQILYRGFEEDTSRYETPGRHYTLAWTFVLQPVGSGSHLVFHNMLNSWFSDTHDLAKHGANWKILKGLLFVIDPRLMWQEPSVDALPQAEIYARLLRTVEEYCVLRPGRPVPFKVAVLLPLPPKMFDFFAKSAALHKASSTTIEHILAQQDPALFSLLRRTVPRQRLCFFGGWLPPRPDFTQTPWIDHALKWLRH